MVFETWGGKWLNNTFCPKLVLVSVYRKGARFPNVLYAQPLKLDKYVLNLWSSGSYTINSIKTYYSKRLH